MAENGTFSRYSVVDIIAMNEALKAQQKLLHKLYGELDQEREASETAASEALSMIMRLQVVKAAVEMEAKQYKRMVEEKLFHANECIGVLDGVVYQKNMEIASLECEIQAYKYKLLSLGCYDIECGETINESISYQNDSVNEEKSSGGERVKMSTVLPLVRPIMEKEKASVNCFAWTESDTLSEECKNIEANQELEVETSDIGSSLWQQILKLDENVKGIVNAKEFGNNNRRNSDGSLCSHRSINALNSGVDSVKKKPEILKVTKTIDEPMSSTRVQDIFEVPEVTMSHTDVAGKQKAEPDEESTRGKNKRLEPDSPTMIKSIFKSEPKGSFHSSPENKLFKSSSVKNFDIYASACTQPALSDAESNSVTKQLSMRIDQLEQSTSGQSSRPEITVIVAEELGSLKESLNTIQAQLSKIQSEIKSLKQPKSKKQDDSAFNRLQEAMLHFWL